MFGNKKEPLLNHQNGSLIQRKSVTLPEINTYYIRDLLHYFDKIFRWIFCDCLGRYFDKFVLILTNWFDSLTSLSPI